MTSSAPPHTTAEEPDDTTTPAAVEQTTSSPGFFRRDWFGLGLPTDPVQRLAVLLGAVGVVVFLIMARARLAIYRSFDTTHFVVGWFDWMRRYGFNFSERFSDYNVPYLYLLWIPTQFTSDGLLGIKLVSNFGDLLLAIGVYRVIRYFSGPRWALAGAFLILVIPTTWLNSATWGQSDQIYVAVIAHSMAWALRDKQRLAWMAFGLALAFKLQAVFFAPFLLVLWLRAPKRNWSAPAWAVLVWFGALVPAMLRGSSLEQLMMTYSDQTVPGPTTRSSNLWVLFDTVDRDFQSMMVPFAAAVTGALMVAALLKSDWYQDKGRWLSLAAVMCLVLPYLLPTMRNRYFFMAELLALLLAFARPKMWWVALVSVIAGTLGYSVALFGQAPALGNPVSSIPYLVVLLALVRDAFGLGGSKTPAATPGRVLSAGPVLSNQSA